MYYVTTTETINMRTEPNSTNPANIICTLRKGTRVAVELEENRWLRVAGGWAWIAGWLTKQDGSTAPAQPQPQPSQPPVIVLPPVQPGNSVGKFNFDARMRGVHGSAGGWSPTDTQLALIQANRIETVFIATYEPGQAQLAISKLRAVGVKQFVLRACWRGNLDWSSFARGSMLALGGYAGMLGSDGLMIQVHNEPNLKDEGLWSAWSSGRDFAEWWLKVAAQYRKELPGCKLGFPALSPGGDVAGVREAEIRFAQDARPAINAADWVGVHYYWQDQEGADIKPDLKHWRGLYGNKPLIGTEVGPVNGTRVTANAVRRAYSKFAEIGVPCMSWLLSGAGSWHNAAWDVNNVRL